MRLANLIVVAVFPLVTGACGAKAAPPAEPISSQGGEPGEPGDEPAPAGGPHRTVEECDPLLDHVQEGSVEAIDRQGMMAACQTEWTDARVACLRIAETDDAIASCW